MCVLKTKLFCFFASPPFISHRVQNLKESIERLHGIPAAKQVLMISGGEVLNPVSRVCSYSSGTDENPIYMFSILFDNSKLLPPWPSECRKYLFVISINLRPTFFFYYSKFNLRIQNTVACTRENSIPITEFPFFNLNKDFRSFQFCFRFLYICHCIHIWRFNQFGLCFIFLRSAVMSNRSVFRGFRFK